MKAESVTLVENKAETQAILTIKDGSLTARITLFGQYAAAGRDGGYLCPADCRRLKLAVGHG